MDLLYGLWNILTIHGGKGGYSRHPETLRWVGKQKALYIRHEKIVQQFEYRGYKHHSPLDKRYATGLAIQQQFINTKREQIDILNQKPCDCQINIDKSHFV